MRVEDLDRDLFIEDLGSVVGGQDDTVYTMAIGEGPSHGFLPRQPEVIGPGQPSEPESPEQVFAGRTRSEWVAHFESLFNV